MEPTIKLLAALSVASDVYSHVEIDRGEDSVRISDESLAISPLDKQVLAKALSLCPEAQAAGVCDAGQERALRYAAAMGVRHLFRINACPSDAYSAAAALTDFLKSHPAQVVLCGQAAWDYATGDFPKWLSQLTGIGLLEDVCDFRLCGEGSKYLEVVCRTDTRSYSLRVNTPVILACNKAIYPEEQIRIPSMREMMLAMRSEVAVSQQARDLRPKKLFFHYRPMPSRPPVHFLAADDYAAMADIVWRAGQENDRPGEDCQAEIFSGRVLAEVKISDAPRPVRPEAEWLAEETVPSHPDLKTARIIVSGGMGVEETVWPLLEELAGLCHGALGCTRPVYQAGRRPYFEHVGQTGAKVAPALYLAVGISGALQHVAGMIRSAQVFAINTDPDAEIFKYADYGVVGDARAVLTGLIKELHERGKNNF